MSATSEQSESIVILDFGSQYAQLIARRVRENGVYSVLARPDVTVEEVSRLNCKGLIFTGGPASVYAKGAPQCRREMLDLGVPILGICYGMQVVCQMLGAEIESAAAREYGRASLQVIEPDALLRNIPAQTTVWMSHGDQIQAIGKDFVPLATTRTCPVAAVRHKSRPFFGVQFHPEVTHTPRGSDIFVNFIYDICGCAGLWKMGSFIDAAVEDVRGRVADDEQVICGLSGGLTLPSWPPFCTARSASVCNASSWITACCGSTRRTSSAPRSPSISRSTSR